jgi:rSAM/selenodomain-associated transferase 2
MNVSVIIPTLNEAGRIAQVIRKARDAGAREILVVDGHSEDGTLDHASAADVRLTADRGRAAQQNAGAAASRGDVLLFLHADCWLEPGGLDAVERALAERSVVAGCFRQSIDAPGFAYRLLERGNALRVRLCGRAYGDQGIFIRREVFEDVGGFPDLNLMEDLFLMRRLSRQGRIALADAKLHVSPRRWQAVGVVRQTLRNWAMLSLVRCGISPNRLARYYATVR